MPRSVNSDYIFDLPTVGQAVISPDGTRVVYTRSDISRETMRVSSHLEIVPFEGGAPRVLTAGDGDSMPRWSPDGSQLAFLRARRDEDGQPDPAQVWVLPLDGGEATRITAIAGGVTSIAWMPSGGQLLVIANVDPAGQATDGDRPSVQRVNRIYYRADGIGWRGDSHRQLFIADLEGNGLRQITRGDHDASDATPSPDGRRVAFFSTDRSSARQARLPGTHEVCVVPARGGSVERLVRNVRDSGAITWSPDGRELAYVAADEDSYNYVWAVSRRSGEPRRLTDDTVMPLGSGFPLAEGPPIVWHRRRITFLAAEHGAGGVYSVAASGGRLQRIRGESEVALSFSSTPDAAAFALTTSALRRPPEVAAHVAATGDSRRLTFVSRDYLRGRAIGRTERFTVRRDDLDIDCFLTFPPRFDRGRRYPLILNVHGGPNGFFAPGWMPQVQALAAQGYLVLSTNPRGSASFGANFMARVFEDWGGEDYEDHMAALDRVLQRSYVDGRRLGVMGYSYGGFMTSWIIGHTNRFKSAIVGAPVTNLYSMYGTTDIAVSFGERQWGGPPWTNLEAYAEHSPITYARDVETPVLLMHGELDIRCPIAQSEEYYVALKRLGKQVEFIRFPGGYHGFPNAGHPKLRQAFLDEQLAWWKQTL